MIFPLFVDLLQELTGDVHGNEDIASTISINVLAIFLIELVHLSFFLFDQHILLVFVKVVLVLELHFEGLVVRKLYLEY